MRVILRSCKVDLHFEKNGRDPGINSPVKGKLNFTKCHSSINETHKMNVLNDSIIITLNSQTFIAIVLIEYGMPYNC